MNVSRSPRGSTASDDAMATYNGRLALEEVVAKLNDLDRDALSTGSNTSSVGGGGAQATKGMVSRLPFLSALFATNRSMYSDSLLTDEEDRNQEDNPMLDIFLWRFPLVSMVWFLVFNLIFFLHFAGVSWISIGSVLGLWQLVLDFALHRVMPQLQERGLVSAELSAADALRKNTFFTRAFVKRFAGIIYEIADLAIGLWRFTVIDANLGRVLVASRFVFLVLIRSMSLSFTLYIVLFAFFTIPVSYQGHKAIADIFAETHTSWITQWEASVEAECEKLASTTKTSTHALPPVLKYKRILARKLKHWMVG